MEDLAEICKRIKITLPKSMSALMKDLEKIGLSEEAPFCCTLPRARHDSKTPHSQCPNHLFSNSHFEALIEIRFIVYFHAIIQWTTPWKTMYRFDIQNRSLLRVVSSAKFIDLIWIPFWARFWILFLKLKAWLNLPDSNFVHLKFYRNNFWFGISSVWILVDCLNEPNIRPLRPIANIFNFSKYNIRSKCVLTKVPTKSIFFKNIKLKLVKLILICFSAGSII